MDEQPLLDALELQIWTAAPTGLLTYVNPFTARYFGRTQEQLVGEGWQNVLHSADLSLAVERWSRSLESGEPYEVSFRLLRGADRSYRWHRATACRLEGPRGRFWLGSNLDIDAERRAAEAFAMRLASGAAAG